MINNSFIKSFLVSLVWFLGFKIDFEKSNFAFLKFMTRCQMLKYNYFLGVCLGPTKFEIAQPNWQYKIQSILYYQVNLAIRRHCWRLRLEKIDSSIKLFDKKKSEPTILAKFHQSFRYQRVICKKYIIFLWIIEYEPVHISRVFKGSINQFRNNEFSRLFDQLAQLLLCVCSLVIVFCLVRENLIG